MTWERLSIKVQVPRLLTIGAEIVCGEPKLCVVEI
jgi:hypothetical protein